MRVILLIVLLLFVIGVGEAESCKDGILHGYCVQTYNRIDKIVESCYALEPALCTQTISGDQCSCPAEYEQVTTGILKFEKERKLYRRTYTSCYRHEGW